MTSTTGQAKKASTPLLPIDSLAQGCRSDTGQCRANFFSAQVELAGAFSAVSSTDDKDLAVIMGRLAVILRNVSLDVA